VKELSLETRVTLLEERLKAMEKTLITGSHSQKGAATPDLTLALLRLDQIALSPETLMALLSLKDQRGNDNG
jgi:hypothetical protein